jgi:hypothetical protein
MNSTLYCKESHKSRRIWHSIAINPRNCGKFQVQREILMTKQQFTTLYFIFHWDNDLSNIHIFRLNHLKHYKDKYSSLQHLSMHYFSHEKNFTPKFFTDKEGDFVALTFILFVE